MRLTRAERAAQVAGWAVMGIALALMVWLLTVTPATSPTPEPATAQIICEAAPPLLPSFEACFTK